MTLEPLGNGLVGSSVVPTRPATSTGGTVRCDAMRCDAEKVHEQRSAHFK